MLTLLLFALLLVVLAKLDLGTDLEVNFEGTGIFMGGSFLAWAICAGFVGGIGKGIAAGFYDDEGF